MKHYQSALVTVGGKKGLLREHRFTYLLIYLLTYILNLLLTYFI